MGEETAKSSKELHHTDSSTTQHQKNPAGLNPNKLEENVWRPGEGGHSDQQVGKVGEEQSGWVSHIHTLRVETGH